MTRKQLLDIFQWLYQEIILKLSTQLNSSDLVKYLNLMLMRRYPQLATYLQVKSGMSPIEPLDQCDFRKVDHLCSLLEKDQSISLEILLSQQLNMFYQLQPEMSTVQNVGDDNLTIRVVEEAILSNQTEHEEQKEDLIKSIVNAVKQARSDSKSKGRSASPDTALQSSQRESGAMRFQVRQTTQSQ